MRKKKDNMSHLEEWSPYEMALDVPVVERNTPPPKPLPEEWRIVIHKGDSQYNSLLVSRINGGWYILRTVDVNGAGIPITPAAMRAIAELIERES